MSRLPEPAKLRGTGANGDSGIPLRVVFSLLCFVCHRVLASWCRRVIESLRPWVKESLRQSVAAVLRASLCANVSETPTP